MIGYSSHGKWVSSKEIYELEEERDNIVDPILLQDGYEAIWICRNKKDAIRYLLPASEWNNITEKIIKAHENELIEVDLNKTLHVENMNDGDGGELWIRRIKK